MFAKIKDLLFKRKEAEGPLQPSEQAKREWEEKRKLILMEIANKFREKLPVIKFEEDVSSLEVVITTYNNAIVINVYQKEKK